MAHKLLSLGRMLPRRIATPLASVTVGSFVSLSAIACGGAATNPPAGGQQPTGGRPGPDGGPTVAQTCTNNPTLETIGTGTTLVSGLGLTSTSVVWAAGNPQASEQTSVIVAPKAGGPTRTLAGGPWGRVGATDEQAVYLVTGAGNANGFGLVRVPFDGSDSVPLASNVTGIGAVAVAQERVYWETSGEMGDCFGSSCPATVPDLWSEPDTGGSTATIAPGVAARYMRADGANLFWSSGDAIQRMPTGGGTPAQLAGQASGYVLDVEIDDANVYWSQADVTDQSAPTIRSVPKTGGSTVTLATTQSRSPGAIAVDGLNVYWLDDVAHGLMGVPKSGGSPRLLAPIDPKASMGSVAADSSGVYLSVNVACGQPCSGTVFHLRTPCP